MKCAICRRECGDEVPKLAGGDFSVYHLACAMEQVYAARGQHPSQGMDAEAYARACKKREEQVEPS